MDSRMGRSKAVPALRVSAGARLTVRRDTGQSNEQDFAAARTRSPASLTAPVGSPTTSSRGSPPESRHSTVTIYPFMPSIPAENTRETMLDPSFPREAVLLPWSKNRCIE